MLVNGDIHVLSRDPELHSITFIIVKLFKEKTRKFEITQMLRFCTMVEIDPCGFTDIFLMGKGMTF